MDITLRRIVILTDLIRRFNIIILTNTCLNGPFFFIKEGAFFVKTKTSFLQVFFWKKKINVVCVSLLKKVNSIWNFVFVLGERGKYFWIKMFSYIFLKWQFYSYHLKKKNVCPSLGHKNVFLPPSNHHLLTGFSTNKDVYWLHRW